MANKTQGLQSLLEGPAGSLDDGTDPAGEADWSSRSDNAALTVWRSWLNHEDEEDDEETLSDPSASEGGAASIGIHYTAIIANPTTPAPGPY